MKKVIVFGGLGFIGGHLVEELVARGMQVTVFDRLKNEAPYRKINAVYNYFQGDVTDAQAVDDVMFGADYFVNLAGILGTSETVDNPFPSVHSNIIGALNIFNAARRNKVKGVQIAVGNHWMNNSYSITKTTAERFAFMFNKEHGTKIAVVRALNAYGERQKHAPVRKIMPNFICKALRNEPIKIYGDGSQIMDMVYVKDVAQVLANAMEFEHGVYDRVFEIGTGRQTTVNEIAEMVCKFAGSKAGVEHVTMRAGEPEHAIVVGDPKTLVPLFAPYDVELDTLEGKLPQVINWYRENYPWQNDWEVFIDAIKRKNSSN